jgi:hypothetical protein
MSYSRPANAKCVSTFDFLQRIATTAANSAAANGYTARNVEKPSLAEVTRVPSGSKALSAAESTKTRQSSPVGSQYFQLAEEENREGVAVDDTPSLSR